MTPFAPRWTPPAPTRPTIVDRPSRHGVPLSASISSTPHPPLFPIPYPLVRGTVRASRLQETERMADPSPLAGQALPSGTVTFLLSDVERSTALWEQAP